jgi:hypothetical protein
MTHRRNRRRRTAPRSDDVAQIVDRRAREPIGRRPGRHGSERAGHSEPAGCNAANQAAGVQQRRDRAFGASAPTIRSALCVGEPLATSLSAANSSGDQFARLSLRLATAFRVAASTVAPGTWLGRLSLARRQRRRRDLEP